MPERLPARQEPARRSRRSENAKSESRDSLFCFGRFKSTPGIRPSAPGTLRRQVSRSRLAQRMAFRPASSPAASRRRAGKTLRSLLSVRLERGRPALLRTLPGFGGSAGRLPTDAGMPILPGQASWLNPPCERTEPEKSRHVRGDEPKARPGASSCEHCQGLPDRSEHCQRMPERLTHAPRCLGVTRASGTWR